MGILIGFLPFIAFAILSTHVGVAAALAAGACVSLVLLVRGRLAGSSVKILEAGTLILFLALSVYAALSGSALSIFGAKLCVDIGLLLIAVLSMLLGRPFTLQYAREQVPQQYWDSPKFIKTNYVITAGWAVVFLVIVIAEAVILNVPDLPTRAGTIIVLIPLLCGIAFTRWYAGKSRQAS